MQPGCQLIRILTSDSRAIDDERPGIGVQLVYRPGKNILSGMDRQVACSWDMGSLEFCGIPCVHENKAPLLHTFLYFAKIDIRQDRISRFRRSVRKIRPCTP